MSNSIDFSETNRPNDVGLDGVIPYDLITNKLPSAIRSTVQRRQVQASNGVVANPNTMIQFQIPSGQGQGYLKRNSVLFRFQCLVPTVSSSSTTWSFQGACNNAQMVIKNIRVLLGNTIVESIVNYNQFQSIHLSHATNTDYVFGPLNIMEGAMNDSSGLAGSISGLYKSQGYAAQAAATPFEFVCQLQLGTLNSTIPMFLLNGSPLTIQIDTASVSEAVVSLDGSASTPIPTYQLLNSSLLYETIDIDNELKQSIKQHLQETGEMYELKCSTVLGVNTSVTSNQSLNYNMSVNLGSVDCVLYTSVKKSTFDNLFGVPSWKINGYLESSVTDAQYDKRLLVDGRLVNQYRIQDLSQIYTELSRCFSQYNTNISALGAMNERNSVINSSYPSRFFAGGFNLRKDLSNECSLSGTKVGVVQLNFDTSSSNSNVAGTYFIFVCFDQKIMISGNGDVMVAK